MTLTRLEHPRPGDPSQAAVEEIYRMATDRDTDRPVDCASCTQRHPRIFLTWFQANFDEESGWFVAPICGGCETLDIDQIEHQIIHRQQPPLRKMTGIRADQRVTFWVTDPDFAMDRRS